MNLAEKCINYRALHKMTQAELAQKTGLSWATIQKVESGGKIRKTTAIIIEMVVGKDNENK